MEKSELLKLGCQIAAGALSNPSTASAVLQSGTYAYQQILRDCTQAVDSVACQLGIDINAPEQE